MLRKRYKVRLKKSTTCPLLFGQYSDQCSHSIPRSQFEPNLKTVQPNLGHPLCGFSPCALKSESSHTDREKFKIARISFCMQLQNPLLPLCNYLHMHLGSKMQLALFHCVWLFGKTNEIYLIRITLSGGK